MYRRVAVSMGSAVTLLGAFVVGGVLHAAFVERSIAASSPVAVFGALAGAGLIAVGLRLERRFDPSEYVPDAEEESEAEDRDAAAFSPVSEEMLADRERDDRNRGRGRQ